MALPLWFVPLGLDEEQRARRVALQLRTCSWACRAPATAWFRGAASAKFCSPSRAAIPKRAQAAALDPAALAGHFLRSGFATQAARDGHHAAQIADVTRHRDRRVLDGYIQAGRGARHVARML